ncbi:3-hydroxyacyl-CoA dehydrogenase NAD-binding domain-containing protein [Halovenus halobia]|uniref:3-hydroxyacyl-CoA dehydrogenase n=1 Tax=Halovenus halobia TaxID=3396622 RepID=UPI003F566E8E
MKIDSTGVVGAGLMGRDIAGLLANAGYAVTLVDVDQTALQDASAFHESELVAELERSNLDVADEPAARINYSTELQSLSGADFVVEAVPENLELKRGLMGDLEDVLRAEAVIGTNTSSLTPGDIAASLEHPERVVLFHFANPALHRDIVELSGDQATARALDAATAVAETIGRTPIRLQTEYRANGLSRLSASIKCAASWELLRAEPAAVDSGARNAGFDTGPFELIDQIGLDVHLDTVDNLSVYGERYQPPTATRERMEQMVEDGHLGKKTSRGFFEWDNGECRRPKPDDPHDVTPILAALANEAHRLVADGVADADTVNEILKRGGDSETGPFDIEEMFGAAYLREVLEQRYDDTGGEIYNPIF